MATIDGLNVELSELTACAGNIRKANQKMSNSLENIRSRIKGLAGSWESNAATTTRNNFNKTAERFFDDYKKKVDNYAIFLDNTVETYSKTEKKLDDNAALFEQG